MSVNKINKKSDWKSKITSKCLKLKKVLKLDILPSHPFNFWFLISVLFGLVTRFPFWALKKLDHFIETSLYLLPITLSYIDSCRGVSS